MRSEPFTHVIVVDFFFNVTFAVTFTAPVPGVLGCEGAVDGFVPAVLPEEDPDELPPPV